MPGDRSATPSRRVGARAGSASGCSGRRRRSVRAEYPIAARLLELQPHYARDCVKLLVPHTAAVDFLVAVDSASLANAKGSIGDITLSPQAAPIRTRLAKAARAAARFSFAVIVALGLEVLIPGSLSESRQTFYEFLARQEVEVRRNPAARGPDARGRRPHERLRGVTGAEASRDVNLHAGGIGVAHEEKR